MWFLLEQPADVRSRHMSFNRVSTDFRAMAGAKAVGHAGLLAFCGNIAYIGGFHLESILAKVLDPCTATTTGRTFEDFHSRSALGECCHRRTFMLTHWTRDRTRGPLLSLEHVVHRQTRQTAELYGLRDRGLIAPGM